MAHLAGFAFTNGQGTGVGIEIGDLQPHGEADEAHARD